jgi:hypothetical protein
MKAPQFQIENIDLIIHEWNNAILMQSTTEWTKLKMLIMSTYFKNKDYLTTTEKTNYLFLAMICCAHTKLLLEA